MASVGGEIVYSTCTLTIEENEFIINKVISKYPVELVEFELDLPHINGYTQISDFKFDQSLIFTKRVIPWELKSEGFFIAKLRKTKSIEQNRTTKKLTVSKKRTVNSNNKQMRTYITQLSDHFCIDKCTFEQYRFIFSNGYINFTNIDSIKYDADFFFRIGTKFGIIDKNGVLKLHTHAAQILGKFAKKNIFELHNKSELKIYFSGGVIYRSIENKGQKIVKYNGHFLGTGIADNKQLKSQFPRSKRTGNIYIS